MFIRALQVTLVFLLLLHIPAYAQVSSGAVLGTVSDSSGARIPGVEVTATNLGTNQTRTAVTTETGEYRIEPLQIGVYTVSAELPGFKKEVRSNLKIDVDARLRIDFTMQVGAVSEVVEVSGQAPVVQTDNSQVGQVVEERKIVELPLNGRNFSSLAYITPGTFAPRPGSHLSDRGGFVAAGMEEQANGFLLDGVNGNASITMEPAIRVNIDAVAEFKIQTQNYAAQYGRFAGAQVDAITKSGTNELHGTGFFFGRNERFDARNFFEAKKPAFSRYQYGGVLGGPIIKDKTFFFVGFQGQQQDQSLTIVSTVPLAEFWTGNLSRINRVIRDPQNGQPFPNNQIPASRISRIALGFRPYWERATLTDANALTSNALSTFDQPDDYSLPNLKINHALTSNNQLIFSYGYFRENFLEYNFNRPEIPGFQTCCGLRNHIVSLQDVWTITPSVVNEFRAGVSRSFRTRHPEDRKANYARQLGINGTAADADPILWATPQISITGYAKLGDSTNQDRVDGNWTFADVVSLQRGSHAIKFGADHMLQYVSSSVFYFSQGGSFTFTGSTTGDPFADFLLGYAETSLRNPPIPNTPLTSYLFRKNYGFFAQDDFKLNSNLTLNVGMRWDYFGPLDEKYGKLSTFDPTLNNGRGGIRILEKGLRRFQPGIDYYKSLYPDLAFGTSKTYTKWQKNNPGPRFGFAWTPGGRTSTVLRGGYGILYQVEDLCFCNNSTQAPFTISQTFTRAQTPTLENPWPATAAGGAITINSLWYDVESARYEHWNFGVQRELPASIVVDASYVAKRGTRVNRYRSLNQPINGVRPYPLFQPNLDFMDNGIRLMYHGMQLRVERRASQGLSILNSYAWSHMIDNGQPRKNGSASQYRDSYNLNLDKGNGVEDGRHRLSTSFVWDMPFGQNLTGAAAGLLKGWQVSGIFRANSGNQLTPTLSFDNNGDGRTSDRPDLIGDPKHTGKIEPRGSFWQKSAFQVTPGTYGNAGRGILRTPGYIGTDMSFVKKFTIAENKDLQFRWEMFNIFNNVNFYNPVTVFNAANFGNISAALPSRQMQFGAKFAF